MPGTTKGWTDERMEQRMAMLLRAGVGAAAAIVLIGATCFLIRHAGVRTDYRVFRSEPAELRVVSAIVKGVVALQCRELIQFGLLILIGTPIARVAFSVFSFVLQRDYVYTVITLIVLAILFYSLTIGV